MRPQLMSVMCSRPSMPPRSTNAPKSAMFLTMPLRVWPILDFRRRASALASPRSSSMSLRRLMTMLRRSRSILRIFGVDRRGRCTRRCRPGRRMSTWRGRQEDRHADVHQQAALDLAGDLAGDGVAFLVGVDDAVPSRGCGRPCAWRSCTRPVSDSTCSRRTSISSPTSTSAVARGPTRGRGRGRLRT